MGGDANIDGREGGGGTATGLRKKKRRGASKMTTTKMPPTDGGNLATARMLMFNAIKKLGAMEVSMGEATRVQVKQTEATCPPQRKGDQGGDRKGRTQEQQEGRLHQVQDGGGREQQCLAAQGGKALQQDGQGKRELDPRATHCQSSPCRIPT